METLFPAGGTDDVPSHLGSFLTLREAVRAGATCRGAHSGLRWAPPRGQLEWLPGSGCPLPHALARYVAGQLVRQIRFLKPGDEGTNPEVLDSWLGSIVEHCPGLHALNLDGCGR